MTEINNPEEPGQPSGDRPYELPTPNMDVFGPDDHPTEPGSTGAVPPPPPEHPRGSMRFQDPSTTRPHEPSLAEQRARQQAQEAEAEAELAAQIAAGRKAVIRRRVMIGGGVTVGIAALVGAWYLFSPSNVTARCTSDGGSNSDTVVQDQYCDESYVTSHHGYFSNGIAFIPIPGGGFSQYRYYYGGSGSVGQHVSGGSYSAPSNGTVKTGSGKTISRGGLGVSGSHGGSSGGGGEGGGGHSGGS